MLTYFDILNIKAKYQDIRVEYLNVKTEYIKCLSQIY